MRLFLLLAMFGCSDPEDPAKGPCGDIDADGLCDEDDADMDNDGCDNTIDRRPTAASFDEDGDGISEDCDLCVGPDGNGDFDGDGVCPPFDIDDDNDRCNDDIDPNIGPPIDSDRDGVGDDCDACRGVDRYGDYDLDGICDDIDEDIDDDGCINAVDDNPWEFSADLDGDGLGDGCDPDDDDDGCLDGTDDKPHTASGDLDGDGIADDCDNDDDNDGCLDPDDPLPLVFSPDIDGDGNGNDCDLDDDGDNCLDTRDHEPLTPGLDCLLCDVMWDVDQDGDCHDVDIDEDGDGCPDLADDQPTVPSSDFDLDGFADDCDFDDDNDGCADIHDPEPLRPTGDEDGDGLDDSCDNIHNIFVGPERIAGSYRTAEGVIIVGATATDQMPETMSRITSDGRVHHERSRTRLMPVPSHGPCDLDGDGYDELITTDFRVRSPLDVATEYVLETHPDWGVLEDVVCADLDLDDKPEVIGDMNLRPGRMLIVWSSEGQLLHTRVTGNAIHDRPYAAQIDTDPQLEIISTDGDVLDGVSYAYEDTLLGQHHAFADIDGDGRDEHLFHRRGDWEFHRNGRLLWSHTAPPGPSFLGDVDDDGTAELVLATEQGDHANYVVLNPSGTVLEDEPGRACLRWVPTEYDNRTVLLCDVADHDDLVFDAVLSGVTVLMGQGSATTPLAADLDDDGEPEVLWMNDDRTWVAVRSKEGELLSTFYDPFGCATVIDADDDGSVELVSNFIEYAWLDHEFVEVGRLIPGTSNSCVLGVLHAATGQREVVIEFERAVGLINPATGVTTPAATALFVTYFDLLLMDLDRDGDTDWVGQSGNRIDGYRFGDATVTWPMNGSGMADVGGKLAIVRLGQVDWLQGNGSTPVTTSTVNVPHTYRGETPWAEGNDVWFLADDPSGRVAVSVGETRVNRALRVPASASAGATAGEYLWVSSDTSLFRIDAP